MTETETETERRSFLGIPVVGEINKHSNRTPQRPLVELEPLIRAVLADDEIYAFGWQQYTPYFNDGEPCIFRVHEAWFLTVTDVVKMLEEEGQPTQVATPWDMASEVLRRAGLEPDQLLKPTEPQPSLETVAPVVVDRERLPDFDDLPEFDWDEYTVGYGEHPSLGKAQFRWLTVDGDRQYVEVPGTFTGPDRQRYQNAHLLSQAFSSDAFGDVLLTAFGDHCEVIVRRSGISVNEYSHD